MEEIPHATEVYNQQCDCGIGRAPADAVRLKRTEQDKVKKHVKKSVLQSKKNGTYRLLPLPF